MAEDASRKWLLKVKWRDSVLIAGSKWTSGRYPVKTWEHTRNNEGGKASHWLKDQNQWWSKTPNPHVCLAFSNQSEFLCASKRQLLCNCSQLNLLLHYGLRHRGWMGQVGVTPCTDSRGSVSLSLATVDICIQDNRWQPIRPIVFCSCTDWQSSSVRKWQQLDAKVSPIYLFLTKPQRRRTSIT